MKLFLMRHGEASFDAPTDESRELTERGLLQSDQMGTRLSVYAISLVLVSPYVRTQHTWKQVQPHLAQDVQVHILDELKPNADVTQASHIIEAYCDKYGAEDVLVISHMPILGELVCEFGPQFSPTSFVPSSVVELDSWKVGEAKLLEFYLPDK